MVRGINEMIVIIVEGYEMDNPTPPILAWPVYSLWIIQHPENRAFLRAAPDLRIPDLDPKLVLAPGWCIRV